MRIRQKELKFLHLFLETATSVAKKSKSSVCYNKFKNVAFLL